MKRRNFIQTAAGAGALIFLPHTEEEKVDLPPRKMKIALSNHEGNRFEIYEPQLTSYTLPTTPAAGTIHFEQVTWDFSEEHIFEGVRVLGTSYIILIGMFSLILVPRYTCALGTLYTCLILFQ